MAGQANLTRNGSMQKSIGGAGLTRVGSVIQPSLTRANSSSPNRKSRQKTVALEVVSSLFADCRILVLAGGDVPKSRKSILDTLVTKHGALLQPHIIILYSLCAPFQVEVL